MKRFIMPLTAFLMVGTVLFTGCNKEEVPEEQTPVVDTLTPPADVDTLVVDTAGTGTEVKVVDSDSAKKAAGGKTKAPAKKDDDELNTDGNTGTRRPQRDNTNNTNTTPSTSEPTKTTDPANTSTKRPQRP